MKFFHWMHSKFDGGVQAINNNKSSNAAVVTSHLKMKEPQKQEFGDWPNELLSIGTFGDRDLIRCNKQENRAEKNRSETYPTPRDDEHRCSSPDLSEFSSEEVIHLQRELEKLLTRKHDASKSECDSSSLVACPDRHTDHLPLDRFLNCPSSLEVDRECASNNRFSVYSDDRDRDEEIDRTIRIILGLCKDVREKKCKKKYIGKKSMSFIVKKMFGCAGEFVAKTDLRDSFQELRMEKLLRTMLSRKIYPQTCSRTSSTKQHLQDHRSTMRDQKEEEEDESRNKDIKGYKWDKTDKEYIVLEI